MAIVFGILIIIAYLIFGRPYIQTVNSSANAKADPKVKKAKRQFQLGLIIAMMIGLIIWFLYSVLHVGVPG